MEERSHPRNDKQYSSVTNCVCGLVDLSCPSACFVAFDAAYSATYPLCLFPFPLHNDGPELLLVVVVVVVAAVYVGEEALTVWCTEDELPQWGRRVFLDNPWPA